jgi:serine/threonine-protein kinase
LPRLPASLGDAASSGHPTWGPLILVERIAGGAYGDVYRARDPHLDREVALKLLRSDPAGPVAPAQGTVGEARLLARVRHRHVVTVYGADRFDGRVGLWMEFIHGRTLGRELHERGPLSAQEATVIGLDVCGGLAAIHQAGLVHRDIKAENVMREVGGRIVLMDLGAGREQADRAEAWSAGLAGTPVYAAPEVLAGQPATPSSDIYGLGVLLYQLVTGSYPVVAPTIEALRDAHRSGQRRPLRDARPDLPGTFVATIGRIRGVSARAPRVKLT